MSGAEGREWRLVQRSASILCLDPLTNSVSRTRVPVPEFNVTTRPSSIHQTRPHFSLQLRFINPAAAMSISLVTFQPAIASATF
jgi:hypothetical protein